MKPIIGIISNNAKNDTSIIYNDVIKSVELSGGEPLGLISNIDTKVGDNILKNCDGFIFQGGHEINDFHLELLDYAHKNSKPILGICMGFQLIATKFFGIGSVMRIEHIKKDGATGIIEHQTFIEDDEDLKKCVHKIDIEDSSILYPIFGDSVSVNSRHIKTVVHVEKPFIVTAKSEDGLIEMIEYIDEKNFIIGVQFHPENLDHMKPLFDLFVKQCKKRSAKAK